MNGCRVIGIFNGIPRVHQSVELGPLRRTRARAFQQHIRIEIHDNLIPSLSQRTASTPRDGHRDNGLDLCPKIQPESEVAVCTIRVILSSYILEWIRACSLDRNAVVIV